MTPEDYSGFCSSMKMLGSAFPSWKVTGDDLDGWFQLLSDYDLQAITGAFRSVVMDTSRGAFPPTIPEIVGKLSGGTQNISREHVVNQLEKPTTPLGVLARVNIQSFDRLAGGWQLKEAIDCFVDQIPDLERRVSERGYRQAEIAAFKKYNVSPRAQFGRSVKTPQTENLIASQVQRFREGAPRLENSNHTSEPEDKKLVPAANVASFLEDLKAGINTDKPARAPESKPVTCTNCQTLIGGTYDNCPRCNTEIER